MYKAQASKPRTLAESIHIALDEMFKALETSVAGLSDAQVWSHPIEARNTIGAIVLHVLENIDRHACYFQIGTCAGPRTARIIPCWRRTEQRPYGLGGRSWRSRIDGADTSAQDGNTPHIGRGDRSRSLQCALWRADLLVEAARAAEHRRLPPRGLARQRAHSPDLVPARRDGRRRP